jgi:hypothetical protein
MSDSPRRSAALARPTAGRTQGLRLHNATDPRPEKLDGVRVRCTRQLRTRARLTASEREEGAEGPGTLGQLVKTGFVKKFGLSGIAAGVAAALFPLGLDMR